MTSSETPPRPPGALPPVVQGTLWMLAHAFFFTLMGVVVKYTGGAATPATQGFFRQFAGVLVMTPAMVRLGRDAFRTPRPGVLFWRSAASSVSVVLGFYA